MCEICKSICKEIEETFGHKVSPDDLTNLIESSPVARERKKEKE